LTWLAGSRKVQVGSRTSIKNTSRHHQGSIKGSIQKFYTKGTITFVLDPDILDPFLTNPDPFLTLKP
jgi:hypothetical protein